MLTIVYISYVNIYIAIVNLFKICKINRNNRFVIWKIRAKAIMF